MARPEKGRKRTWRFRLDEGTVLEVSAPARATTVQVRRRGRVSLVLGAVMAAAALAGVALADDVANNVDGTVDATLEAMPLTVGGADGSVRFHLAPTNSDAKSGCNLTGAGSQLVLGISSGNTAVATVSPSSVTITGCDPALSAAVTIHAVAPGSATVSLTFTSVTTTSSATSASAYNLVPGTFTVDVAAPADTDPPVITHSIGMPKYTNGLDTYVTSATTLTFDVDEAGHGDSGLAGCTVSVDGPAAADGSFTCVEGANAYTLGTSAPLALTNAPDGSYDSTATAEDTAGNGALGDAFTVVLDNTAPAFGECTGGPYVLGSGNQAVSVAASDSGSGLDAAGSTLAGTVDTSTIGTKTIQYTAKDNLGNASGKSCDYSVVYDFHGFFRPIDNQPAVNVAKAGSAIPVKFDLGGDQGLGILAAGSPSSVQVACDAGSALDTVEETVTAGGSSLTYDPTANVPYGQYVYVWKTDKAWAGTCRRLDVSLDDGTTHSASFKLTK